MSRRRKLHIAGHTVRLVLFALATLAALRFVLRMLDRHEGGPAVVFGLLLLTGALSLVWRAVLDLRKAARRH